MESSQGPVLGWETPTATDKWLEAQCGQSIKIPWQPTPF